MRCRLCGKPLRLRGGSFGIFEDPDGHIACPHETPKPGEIGVLTAHEPGRA